MAWEDITWEEFMKRGDEDKRELLIKRIEPEGLDWGEVRERMSGLAFQMGLKNPAPLYRVAYNVGALTMPEEIAEEKARIKRNKQIKLAKRAPVEGVDEEAPARPLPTADADAQPAHLHAFFSPEGTIEGRMNALESTVREMAEEIKLLRRVILLMKS